jgi:hypothetical protein
MNKLIASFFLFAALLFAQLGPSPGGEASAGLAGTYPGPAIAGNYAAGAGTAQAQTVTLPGAVTALTRGLMVCWLPAAANTAAGPTLAVNGLTAAAITKYGTVGLVANDILTTEAACAIYDGTQFELINPQSGTGSGMGVFSTSPILATPLISTIYGGSATGSTVTINGTSNGSPSSAYAFIQSNRQYTALSSACSPVSLITISANASCTPGGLGGTSQYAASNTIQMIGADGQLAAIDIDAFENGGSPETASSPQMVFRAAEGTGAAPTAVTTSSYLGVFNYFGYGASQYLNAGNFYFVPTQTFTNTAAGTLFGIQVAGTGSTTLSPVLQATAITLSLPSVPALTTAVYGSLCWNTGGAVTYDHTNTCLASSRRFKHAIRGLSTHTSLALIDKLHPVSFTYNGTNERRAGGLIAEEVAKLDPRLVKADKDGKPLGVMYLDLIPILISAVQEQQAEIDALKTQLAALSKAR